MQSPILAPVIALVLWSFLMLTWLYATRIPAVGASNKAALNPHQSRQEFDAMIPAPVRWKADNYNHLMEQPTLFYAVTLTLALIGAGGGLNATLAWVYVGLRVVHSLVQATVNAIMWRFLIFIAASAVLLVMTLRAAIIVL
jgi:hypothetical protein